MDLPRLWVDTSSRPQLMHMVLEGKANQFPGYLSCTSSTSLGPSTIQCTTVKRSMAINHTLAKQLDTFSGPSQGGPSTMSSVRKRASSSGSFRSRGPVISMFNASHKRFNGFACPDESFKSCSAFSNFLK